jgi:hypothetical protein
MDSLARWDSQRLIELTRRHGCRDTLTYKLMRARNDLLLCLPVESTRVVYDHRPALNPVYPDWGVSVPG